MEGPGGHADQAVLQVLALRRSRLGVQGLDWSEPLRTAKPFGRQDIYADMFDMAPLVCGTTHGAYGACQTLRTERWKLNLFPNADRRYGMLFDLAADPGEVTLLAIAEALGEAPSRGCLLDPSVCTGANCLLGREIREQNARMRAVMGRTTLQAVAASLKHEFKRPPTCNPRRGKRAS